MDGPRPSTGSKGTDVGATGGWFLRLRLGTQVLREMRWASHAGQASTSSVVMMPAMAMMVVVAVMVVMPPMMMMMTVAPPTMVMVVTMRHLLHQAFLTG